MATHGLSEGQWEAADYWHDEMQARALELEAAKVKRDPNALAPVAVVSEVRRLVEEWSGDGYPMSPPHVVECPFCRKPALVVSCHKGGLGWNMGTRCLYTARHQSPVIFDKERRNYRAGRYQRSWCGVEIVPRWPNRLSEALSRWQDEDPRDKGHIGSDGIHTTAAGATVMANLLRELGYENTAPWHRRSWRG
jgi:hypothetical protein